MSISSSTPNPARPAAPRSEAPAHADARPQADAPAHAIATADSPLRADGLIFVESLPLAWLPGAAVQGLELARLNADNHQLLGAEASLGEVRVQDALKDESAALVHELQRLEFKMNILLRLAAQLAVQHQSLPPRQLVRLAARGMEWEGLDAPLVGAVGLVHLYVNAALPQPLQLPCVVVGERLAATTRAAHLRFTGMSDTVTEQLEKLIFRHHRRLIAGAKHSVT